MARYVLEKVQITSALKITFVLFLIVGAIIGFFYALIISGIGFLAESLGEEAFGGLGALRGLGFLLVPAVAIIYAIFATIAVAIWLLLYNLLAGVIGGIEIELGLPKGEATGTARATKVQETVPNAPEQKSIDGF